jgi:hypothetical protein
MRAEIAWIAAISVEKHRPADAETELRPCLTYLPIPEGSSSEAPVIRAGSSRLRKPLSTSVVLFFFVTAVCLRLGIRTAVREIWLRVSRLVNAHCAPHAPKQNRHDEPGDRCKSEGAGGSVSREIPHDCAEYGECDAAKAGAGCVTRRGVLPAPFALQPPFFLPLALVFLDKGGARAEDGRKC